LFDAFGGNTSNTRRPSGLFKSGPEECGDCSESEIRTIRDQHLGPAHYAKHGTIARLEGCHHAANHNALGFVDTPPICPTFFVKNNGRVYAPEFWLVHPRIDWCHRHRVSPFSCGDPTVDALRYRAISTAAKCVADAMIAAPRQRRRHD